MINYFEPFEAVFFKEKLLIFKFHNKYFLFLFERVFDLKTYSFGLVFWKLYIYDKTVMKTLYLWHIDKTVLLSTKYTLITCIQVLELRYENLIPMTKVHVMKTLLLSVLSIQICVIKYSLICCL